MNTIDKILDECSWGYDFLISDYAYNDEQEKKYAKEKLDERKRLKQSLYELIKEKMPEKGEVIEFSGEKYQFYNVDEVHKALSEIFEG